MAALLNANQSYQSNQVTTVGRGQLLVMAYDGMLRFLAEAERAMQTHEYEVQNRAIQKTQAILLELLCTLDHDAFPELANRLDSLYRFFYDQLTQANVADDSIALARVTRQLAQLRDTWAAADQMLRNGEESTAVGGRHT